MAEGQSEDVSQLLEEESAEEENFRLAHQNSTHLAPGASIGLVHSPTTDTLDSVYLDPPISDSELTESVDIKLDEKTEASIEEKVEKTITGEPEKITNTVKKREYREKELSSDAGFEDEKPETDHDIDLDGISLNLDREEFDDLEIKSTTEIKENGQPSLTKYFGLSDGDNSSAADFFSSLPPVNTEEAEVTQEVTRSGADDDILDDLLDLIIDDSEPRTNSPENECKDKTTVSRLSQHEPQPDAESVLFEMTEDVEDKAAPVDIEDEKEDFESFTAETMDTETMDALGMSPAATSFMTERNIKDYFRQSSQADSLRSLGLERQLSSSSGTSGKTGVSQEDNHNITNVPSSDMPLQQSLPLTPSHKVQPESEENMGTTVEGHKAPVVPAPATLSSVESPIHRQRTDSQNLESEPARSSTASLPSTPHHKPDAVPFQTFSESTALDDQFSVSLQMSDEDRRYDAWIPLEETKNILINMATSPPGTYIPQREQLCLPTLVVTESQGDPVKDLVYRYMGEQEALKRQVLTADKVSQDTDGLKELIVAGCLRSAVDLTGSLLIAMGFGEEESEEARVHSPEVLQIWYCRFALLMKLRLYNVVETEFQAFKNLDTPDIYYDFYPQIYPGKRGSMVAFGMRLLHAELPHHLGRSQESLDRFYYILAVTQKILKNLEEGLSEDGSALTISQESRNASQELWFSRETQVLYCIGNTLVAVRDFEGALSIYETLLEKDEQHKVALLSGMGRIHLQIGNLHMASDYFQQVASLSDENEAKVRGVLLMNRGFEAMCQNNFSEAYQLFRSAVTEEPTNTAAINNMAVCCLYLGRLKDALKSLEALVHSDPDKNLHEGILFNLCTLYELESSRALHKKQALLDLVSKHKGDGFPVVCLKMS